MVVVGDSLSVMDSPDFSAGDLGELSWVRYAARSGLRFEGGWAVAGAVTGHMVGGAPVAPGADVLVIMGGTNDVYHGLPFEETAVNLRAVAAKVGADRVVVSGIPPLDGSPQTTIVFNWQLRRLAAEEGWQFVDPMAAVRRGGRFAERMTSDGIHPTRPAAILIGVAVREAVLAGPEG
jgi:hypothetical protein